MKAGIAMAGITAAMLIGLAAYAQNDVFDPAVVAAQERAQLQAAKQQSAAALQRSAALEAKAQMATDAADKLQKRSAALAARIQSAEADISAGEARMALVRRRLDTHQARLAEARQPLLALTATLQQLSRQPPLTVLAQPGSLTDMVHARAVLETALPVIEARTVGVRRELAALRQVRAQAATALAALSSSRRQLTARRSELTRLENEGRLHSRQLMGSARLEADRALGLGEKARDIVDLMEELEVDSDRRADLASLAGPVPRPSNPENPAMAAPDTAPAARNLAASSYRLPVVGRIVTGLGEITDSGVRSRGLTIAAQPGGQVVAPADGRVVFAGTYRDYGKILIIDHGGGWTTLLTGMIGLSASVGDEVDAGSPVGRAGSQQSRITVELRRAGRPVDIAAMLG